MVTLRDTRNSLSLIKGSAQQSQIKLTSFIEYLEDSLRRNKDERCQKVLKFILNHYVKDWATFTEEAIHYSERALGIQGQ